MPAAGEAFTARDLVMQVGAFLAELTSDSSAAHVHAEIVEQVSEPDHDPRLAGAVDGERFIPMWMELASGSSLSEEAWRCVVLPTVVAFSGPNDLKVNLELATSRWMAASMAGDNSSRISAAAEAMPEFELEPLESTASPVADVHGWLPPVRSFVDPVDGTLAPAPPHRRRGLVIVAAAMAALLAAVLVWWTQGQRPGDGNLLSPPPPMPAGDSGPPATATPTTTDTQATPTVARPVGNTAPPPLSTQPVPAPTWNGPGPIVAPTAPRSLTVVGTTDATVSLSWQPPNDAGSGGLAYYRIRRDSIDAGWTAQTSATVTGLTPATSYTFTVTAYNGAGAASPPSSPVTATTQTPQPEQPQQPPPPTPQTGPPPGNPLLATDPPQKPINLGRSFIVTGSGWPCTAPATINVYLGGKLIAKPDVNAQGAFRTTIAVDSGQPNAPTVDVIGSAEPLTLTRGYWTLTARLPAQPSCTAMADQSIQIEFRTGPQ